MILRFPGRFLGGSDCNIMGLCLESRTVGSTVWLSERAPPGGIPEMFLLKNVAVLWRSELPSVILGRPNFGNGINVSLILFY